MKCLITVFLKWPEPGKVKTRLARGGVGPDEAARIYRRLVERVGHSVLHQKRARVCVYFTPPEREQALRKWLEPAVFPPTAGIIWEPQPAGDLGQRQAEAVRRAGRAGFDAVALIGTDCIDITAAHFDKAWSALADGVDWVVGPSHDGGYYLVATRTRTGENTAFFHGVRWSCEHTLSDCLANVAGKRVVTLEALNDIDDREDWLAVRPRLSRSP